MNLTTINEEFDKEFGSLDGEGKLIKSFLEQKIKEVLREVVPEKKDEENFSIPEGADIGAYHHCESLKRNGWNDCIDSLKNKIEIILK